MLYNENLQLLKISNISNFPSSLLSLSIQLFCFRFSESSSWWPANADGSSDESDGSNGSDDVSRRQSDDHDAAEI